MSSEIDTQTAVSWAFTLAALACIPMAYVVAARRGSVGRVLTFASFLGVFILGLFGFGFLIIVVNPATGSMAFSLAVLPTAMVLIAHRWLLRWLKEAPVKAGQSSTGNDEYALARAANERKRQRIAERDAEADRQWAGGAGRSETDSENVGASSPATDDNLISESGHEGALVPRSVNPYERVLWAIAVVAAIAGTYWAVRPNAPQTFDECILAHVQPGTSDRAASIIRSSCKSIFPD